MNHLLAMLALSFLLIGCGTMGSMMGSAVQSGKESAMSGKMATDIGPGETDIHAKKMPYKKKIEKFVSRFVPGGIRTMANKNKVKCAYYGSSGKLNGKSLTMNRALPRVYANCHINGQYTEIYAYGTQKWNGTTAAERVEEWFNKKYENNDQWAVQNNMAIYFEEANETTKNIRSQFLAIN